eukprot:XP_010650345.2 PREDICTED: uncharacterized protein LOC104879376 [Vitis vinifera]
MVVWKLEDSVNGVWSQNRILLPECWIHRPVPNPRFRRFFVASSDGGKILLIPSGFFRDFSLFQCNIEEGCLWREAIHRPPHDDWVSRSLSIVSSRQSSISSTFNQKTIMVKDYEISDLPIEIIHHVMFFLPVTDAIHISVLSKRFNHAWRTFQVMEFDQVLFFTKNKGTANQSQASVYGGKFIQKAMLMRFSNYMDDFLRRREPDIFPKKFKLRTLCVPNIDRYIDFALEKRVQDMEVNYAFLGTPLPIHSSIFVAKSIRVLKLTGLDLGLQDLILSDSLIEELSLNDCCVPETIRVLSEKLLLLKLANCMKLRDIEIDAPNLQSFTYDGGCEPCEINVGALESLKSLSLKNTLITDSWIEENVLKFISLQNLSINGCRNLKKVKIAHGKLKNFEFVDFGNKVELELKLITPSLVSFFYTGILPLHTVITSTQFKARLSLTQISATIEWFLALRHLLVPFNHCKVLTLEFKKQVVFPEELKDKWIAPMFGLKHLRVEVNSCSVSYRDLVAFLLQLSPHPNTLSIVQSFYYRDVVERVIKFKYVKKVAEEDSSCCKHLPVKCWRHYLTNIIMENFEDTDDKESLVMFFKDNMKMLDEKLIISHIH